MEPEAGERAFEELWMAMLDDIEDLNHIAETELDPGRQDDLNGSIAKHWPSWFCAREGTWFERSARLRMRRAILRCGEPTVEQVAWVLAHLRDSFGGHRSYQRFVECMGFRGNLSWDAIALHMADGLAVHNAVFDEPMA